MVVSATQSAAIREFELFTTGDHTGAITYSTPLDAIIEHAAVVGVTTVGAMSQAVASGTGPYNVEVYSSQGPSTIYTDFVQQTRTQRQTLDLTAIDGVQTHAGQLGLFGNPFYGTSAAAPHVAAIAALMLQANPTAPPALIEALLRATAVDIQTGGYDNASGVGLVSADAAVARGMAAVSGGLLTISGTSLDDSLVVTASGTTFSVVHNQASYAITDGTINQVRVNGLGGDDSIDLSTLAIPVVIYGGPGNDILSGGTSHDSIYGGLGDDLIYGGDENDVLSGEDGNDTVYGNFGDDYILGSTGVDDLKGGIDNDTLFGDDGADLLYGGDGSDSISGGAGNDYVEGKGKADTIHGGADSDTILAGAGDDLVYGEDGDDWIYVDDGEPPVFHDTVYGGLGYDRVDFDVLDVAYEYELSI